MDFRGAMILFCLLFLFSCSSRVEESPDIDRDTMVRILADIHISEGAAQQKSLSSDTILFDDSSTYFPHILKTHNIDEATFKKSMDYYISKPQMLDKMYADIIEMLTKMESGVY